MEPAAALESFRVHAGFHLEPVAVEPLVMDPVSACYDADGRLYVVEMRGYPFPEESPSGKVVRLEDRDDDGRFETRTVFLDGLSWPTGIVPFEGGVFVAVAPDILYAKDTDGDGAADLKKVMFTGFGTENVQGLLNGLLWGPDGWIYGVTSSNVGTIQNRSRPGAKRVSVRGRDFRFKPDGSAFEAISGGGQFGHAFDDWGHRFTCNNSNHIRQIVLPSHYLERNPALYHRRSSLISPPKDRPRRCFATARRSRGEWYAPASARRTPCSHGACRRPSCSPSAFSPPRPASPSTEARPTRPSIAATCSSATSGETSSIARPSRPAVRPSWPRGPIPTWNFSRPPTTGSGRSISRTRPTVRC